MSNSNLDFANRDYTVKIGQYFGRGWEIFKQYSWGFIGFFLVMIAIIMIAAELPPVNVIIFPILLAGIYIVAFKITKNKSQKFDDFFLGFKKFNIFLNIFLVNLIRSFLVIVSTLLPIVTVMMIYLAINYFFSINLIIQNLVIDNGLSFWLVLAVAIGILLLITPGIYLEISYFFSVPLVVEKRMEFWSALETSRKLVTKKWFYFLGFRLLLSLLNLGGLLCLVIGLLVTIPLTFCIVVAAYEDIVGLNGGETVDTMGAS